MNQKGLITTILILVAILVIVVVAGVYYLGTKDSSTQAPSNVMPSPALTKKNEPSTQPTTESSTAFSNPQPFPASDLNTFKQIISSNNREGLRNWATNLSINQINQNINNLSNSEKDQLALTVLNIQGDSTPDQKNKLLEAVKEILNNPNLGFYADILSYTAISLEGNGFFGTCGKVMLSPDFITVNVRDLLIHEVFHSFNCMNGGPGSQNGGSHANPLDEGSAIWVTKVAFPQGRTDNELKGGWAETTYGTKNYYRDIGIVGYPHDIPLEIPLKPTQKLKDVYIWLSQNDLSKLPWNNQSKLQSCYDKYYKNIQRNVDFNTWLSQAAQASNQLASDVSCHPD